jgi:acetyl esterase/lipase
MSVRQAFFLAVAVALLVAAVVFRSWVDAQARAVAVLATTLETPVLTWTVAALTPEPRVADGRLAGLPSTVVRPGRGDGPWPAILFVNGATALGRREPHVHDLARGLGRAGYLALVPDLPGLPEGRLGEDALAATLAAVRAAAARPDAEGGRVALVGVSVGATLALLAAEEPSLAERVSVVVGIAPYTDLKEVVRLATTGYHREGDRLVRRPFEPFLALVLARSLAALLPEGPGVAELREELAGVDDDHPDPLAPLRATPSGALGPAAEPFLALVRNRDPVRFDALWQRLPAETRATADRLSPLARADALRAPVELASSSADRYFPVGQARALARASLLVRLTVTDAFSHAVPRPSLADPGDVWRFNAWAVRSLRAARLDPG